MIRDYADVAGVVSALGLDIRDNGKEELSFLCPFHNDRHFGSAYINRDGLYHCFACGKGGTLVSLVREMKRCSSEEAYRFIADVSGVNCDMLTAAGTADKSCGSALTCYEKDVLGIPRSFVLPEAYIAAESKSYRKLISDKAESMRLRYLKLEDKRIWDAADIVPESMKDCLFPYVRAEIRKRVEICRKIAERFS